MAFKYKGLRLKQPYLMRKLKRVTGVSFTRNSVAYDYYGNPIPANTPRFGFGGIDGVLIEEAHTNLMPASESQSLSAPYTTETLNGTYTFMIQGSGSITLSGGATGTVTPGNPVTATVSSATVTLTPTGTATLNQILKLAYPLSWTLGGTTQAAETLTAPSSVLNIDTEGYSNLLPSTQATSLSSKSPYTTTTLVGGVAYTFSCLTGSYVLSGGATGTVTPTNPITVTPGAVTVTLTGDATSNQLSATSTAKPWIPGGTQVNTGTGTIEMEAYFNSVQRGRACYLIMERSGSGSLNLIAIYRNSTQWGLTTVDNTERANTVYINDTLVDGFHKFCGGFDNDSSKLSINGSIPIPVVNPKLPSKSGDLYIGKHQSGGGYWNGIIRNIVISRTRREDADVSNRTLQSSPLVDKKIGFIAPLTRDLRAWRVRT